MWGKELESRLQRVQDVEVVEGQGLQYLPTTEVESLCLRQLGCMANAILVREEYDFALNALEERQKAQNNSGGTVVTGHPGIGTTEG
jgi:hypothetical protein